MPEGTAEAKRDRQLLARKYLCLSSLTLIKFAMLLLRVVQMATIIYDEITYKRTVCKRISLFRSLKNLYHAYTRRCQARSGCVM